MSYACTHTHRRRQHSHTHNTHIRIGHPFGHKILVFSVTGLYKKLTFTSLCVCLWLCVFLCMCVCFGENSASWLAQLDLEPLLKHNKHPPALFSNSNSLTLLSAVFFSFTEIQDPHRKESPLLLQLTQSWRKSKLNFCRGRVCLWKSPDYLNRHMRGINWCLGFWGAGYDRNKEEQRIGRGRRNIAHGVKRTVTAG